MRKARGRNLTTASRPTPALRPPSARVRPGYGRDIVRRDASMGEVDQHDNTGALDMVTNEDPDVTTSELECAEHGIEPLGV